ncbi:MAG: aminopeptidase [Planctomycetota bacterium]|jgi:aminopeptidase
MNDLRITKLAELLVTHSTRLQSGDNVLIEAFDLPDEPIVALIKAARAVGAHPHVAIRHNRVLRALYESAHADGLTTFAQCDRFRMEQMQAYIGLRGSENINELAGIPDEQMRNQARLYGKPVHMEQRVNKTRWCVLRWPTASMAQLARRGTEDFEDFYFDVCTLDYARMQTAAAALAARMDRTDRVRLSGPGETDLSFSIASIPAVACTGSHNIPDGECFTAPVRDSVNGVIQFNTASTYHGTTFENVRLVFENGRVVEATAEQGEQERLDSILDTDDGARHVGEFAIGFNPCIMEPMNDILFDEKIAGSIHFTPGQAYEDANNGNTSEIHWDLVMIQRPEYGGGTIEFDGEVIRKDGLFVADDLTCLNPDALK